jgi:uncharacterized protein (DUF1499 family)
MESAAIEIDSAASRWATRIVMFSVGVLVTALVLHRLFGMPTPIAFNLAVSAYIGVALSLLAAFIASIRIWTHGVKGTARVVFALFVSLILLAGPMAVLALSRNTPPINDLTTDFRSPPPFKTIAGLRGPGANSPDYPGKDFSTEQIRAFPDLKPLVVNRSAEEAFELSVDAVKRLKMTILREDVPDAESGRYGMIEAVDRTLIMGFYDDIAVRVTGNEDRARIDIRSASRFGWSDFGSNAERIRALMQEIVARLDATTPAANEKSMKKKQKSKLKKGKRGRSRGSRRRSRGRGR